ncbi:hypothetical protein EVA_20203, partial [gut metagenome]
NEQLSERIARQFPSLLAALWRVYEKAKNDLDRHAPLPFILTACQPALGGSANSDTSSTQDTSVLQSSNPVENNTDVGDDTASISDANLELLRGANGTVIEETITVADGKQILLNAQVNTESVKNVQQYQYEILPVTDELRKTLFTIFW